MKKIKGFTLLNNSPRRIAKVSHSTGFTLLETVIAIGILVMVGAVAVGASSRAINTGTFSKDRTRAQDIAQKQMEALKVIRDNDYKVGNVWNHNIDACFGGPGQSSSTFYVAAEKDQLDNIILDCGNGKDQKWPDSPTYHVITKLERVSDDVNGNDNGNPIGKTDASHGYPSGLDESQNMRRVTVTVTWPEAFLPGADQKVELKSYITNDKIGN